LPSCVIRGCVPEKLFVLGSRIRDEIEDAARFGWTIGQGSFDWTTLIANKEIAVSSSMPNGGLKRRS
jgi:glutathione reductase (NADPH)